MSAPRPGWKKYLRMELIRVNPWRPAFDGPGCHWTKRSSRRYTARGALSASFFSCELMHPLMRQPKETSGIACAHLQSSCSQYPDSASSGAALRVGLLRSRPSCEESRRPESHSSRRSAASRRPRSRPCAHRRQTTPALLECARRASSTVRPCVWQPRTPRTDATHQPDSSRSYATR